MAPSSSERPREVVTCRLRPDIVKRLDAEAKADNRSRSELIEMLCERGLDSIDKKKPKK